MYQRDNSVLQLDVGVGLAIDLFTLCRITLPAGTVHKRGKCLVMPVEIGGKPVRSEGVEHEERIGLQPAIEAGDGDDIVFGDIGNDTLRGQDGADSLVGGAQ